MSEIGSIVAKHIYASKLCNAMVAGAVAITAASIAMAASPELAPAAKPMTAAAESGVPFVAPPRGTIIEYDTWTCEITRSDKFVSECRDPEGGRVGYYGGFELFGSYTDIPPLRALVPLMSYDLGFDSDRALKVGGFALDEDARSAIASLWPLKAGNSTEYRIDYDARGAYGGEVRVKAESKVERQESVSVGDRTFETFVISQTVRRKVLQTRGEGGPEDIYLRTVWLDAKRGIIVKDGRKWLSGFRKGKTKKYELVNVTFPKDAPLAAAPDPAKVPVPPAGQPPAQTAVAVDLDKQGPVIEVAPLLETDTPVVAIEGRVTDTSRIVLVQFDGQPVPMESDGTISVTRAVPPGSSSFTIVAYDEWGNAGQQVVTVTHKSGSSKPLASAVETPKSATTAAVDSAAPVIELPEAMTTTNKTVSLTGRINDSSKVIEVTVEGRPVTLGADGSFALKRAVSVGTNTIRIAAVDEWGNKAEKQISVERRRPFADINFGTYHAIVIGNNDYAGMPKLKSAVGDAEAVAQTLRQDYGFTIDLLINATRGDIIDALAKARKTLRANDNLLIYYAGHGVLDTYAEEGFWLPVDAEPDSPANWVSNGDVTNMLRAIRAKHVMVVADSCYSGTLVRAVTAKIDTAKERKAWMKKMVTKRTRTALVSGGLEPVIDSGGGAHSVFAKAFLDALRANEDVLEGERLFSVIKRPVALESEQTPQYSDVRRAGHDGGDFMFVRR